MPTKKKTAPKSAKSARAERAAARKAREAQSANESADSEDELEPDEEEGFGEGTAEDEEPDDPTDEIEEELDDEEGDEDEDEDEDEADEDEEDDDDEEVVVVKRRKKPKNPLHVHPVRVRDRAILKNSTVVRVKARKMGFYGNKRRRVGEVFDMRVSGGKPGQLPKWVVALAKARPAENEGSRGISSGSEIADEHMRQRRGVRPGLTHNKIKDRTIIDDALPLSEGGNARKVKGRGNESVL